MLMFAFPKKLNNKLLICLPVLSWTNNEKDGYIKLDRPSALPRKNKSFRSKLLKICFAFLILRRRFISCLREIFLGNIDAKIFHIIFNKYIIHGGFMVIK